MITEIQEKWVLFTKHELNSPMDIGIHASTDEPKLRAFAEKHGFAIVGPLEHAYWNMAVEGVPHIMEIWLPVQNKTEGSSLQNLKRIPKYKCFIAAFKEPIEEIGDAWMGLGEKAKKDSHQLTNHDREIYRMMDCENPENNDIDLQLGIK